MTYLITGATGFIGTRLVHLLLSQGHSVTYAGRQRGKHIDTRAAFFAWHPGEDPPLDSMPRLDAIIHLAGEPIAQRWTPEVKRRIEQSRTDGTRRLVSAVARLRHKPAVLVSASAVGYYGDRGEEVLTEQSAPGQGFLADVCVRWEAEAVRGREYGLRVVPVRIATVLGVAGGALQQMLPPFRFGLGARFGNGQQWMSWIHVQDLLHLLLFTAASPQIAGPVNASAPNPVRNADFTRELAAVLHRPAWFTAPRFALQLALGEMTNFLFDSLRVQPQAALQNGFRFEFPQLTGALEALLSHPKSARSVLS